MNNYIFKHGGVLFHIRNVKDIGAALNVLSKESYIIKQPPTQLYSYSNDDKIDFNIDEYFLMYLFAERHNIKHEIYC